MQGISVCSTDKEDAIINLAGFLKLLKKKFSNEISADDEKYINSNESTCETGNIKVKEEDHKDR